MTKKYPQAWTHDSKHFWGVAETTKKLPSGTYISAWHPRQGAALARHSIKADELVLFSDEQTVRLVNEFMAFWKLKNKYKSMGFLHKRGYLFWGPPGSGKTSLINLLINEVTTKLNGLVVFIKSVHGVTQILQTLREIEPDRPVVIIMEDIDSLVYKNENEYLSILDGSSQIDNVVFIATTNYPEDLDARFTDRPSRFDRVEHIDMPSMAQREQFIALKAKDLSKDEIRRWAFAANGLSIAHLREMIVSVQCLGQELDSVVARLKKMHESLPKSEPKSRSKIGFHRTDDDDDEDDEDEYLYEPAASG